jgi:hypothetical protein
MIFRAASIQTDSNSHISVVETTQNWRRCNLSPRFLCCPGILFSKAFWVLLPNAMMRPGVVVMRDVFLHRAIQSATNLNKHVIQALTPKAADEALTI